MNVRHSQFRNIVVGVRKKIICSVDLSFRENDKGCTKGRMRVLLSETLLCENVEIHIMTV